MKIIGDQKRINRRSPRSLTGDEKQSKPHSRQQRSKGAGGISETAVKSENHDGTGSDPHGADDGHKHIDIIQLRHEKRPRQPEHPAENRHPPQNTHMCLHGKSVFHERNDTVLRDGLRRTEQPGIIRGKHHQHDKECKQTDHSDRKHMTQSHRQHHLMIEGEKLLITLCAAGFAFEFVADKLQMRRIQIFVVRKRRILRTGSADDMIPGRQRSDFAVDLLLKRQIVS